VKRISRLAAVAALSVSVFSVQAMSAKNDIKVIYGDDNRSDVFEVDRADLRELADSTVAVFKSGDLTVNESGKVAFPAKIFGDEVGLCKDEPYRNQPSGAFCSGFLVGEDMIATAGHCVTDELKCATTSFAFGYKMNGPTAAATDVDSSEVYKCAKIIKREQVNDGQDYALIKLDRPVKGHRILKLAAKAPQVQDSVFVIGYPSGIPVKIAGGAGVRSVKNGFFMANLDTYGGNSGSAVFDSKTLEVAGVLVRGERDFVYDQVNACVKSNRCPDGECRGEDVTLISYVAKAMKPKVDGEGDSGTETAPTASPTSESDANEVVIPEVH